MMSNSFVNLSRGSIFPKVVFNTILSLIKLKKFFFDSSPKKAKKAKIRSRKKGRSSILVKPQNPKTPKPQQS